jgi:glycosyltransferase involved in cell wall biosynthesis
MDETSSPKVSVIIPTYNRAHLIGESIQSVLDQTFQDFELIIVDDGSSDDTETVVKGFEDPRIRYIYQENRGISGARNTGIRNAEGQYVAFLDSDDLWLPELLESEVPILDTNLDVGVVYAKAQAMDTDGNLASFTRGNSQRYPDQTLKSALYGDFVAFITAVVRRECFDRIGLFDEVLKGRVDWDIWVRIAKHYRFAYIDKVLAHFRAHARQFTGAASEHFLEVSECGIRVLDKAFSDPELSEETLAIKPLAYRNVYLDIGLRWSRVPAWRESVRYLWKAIRVSPNPLATLLRIGGLILFNKVFSKTEWGNRLVYRLLDLRQRRRAAEDYDQLLPDDSYWP